MILAVTNTTLLSNFAHVSRSDLPSLAFPGLAMPTTVREELDDGERLGLLPALDWSAIPIVVPDAAQLDEVGRLQPPLDRGEISCLALAKGHGAIAITDDRDARKVARTLGLKISGTLGALILLVKGWHLSLGEADALLAKMVASGYRSPKPSIASYL